MGVDLADIQLISKYNNEIRYLLFAIDLFLKYAFLVPLKDKSGTTIANPFRSILNNSKRKPNKIKIWTDQGSEFYNIHFKKWLKDNNMEMYSAHDGRKSAVAQRFIRTLKSKIYKHMTANSENVCFNVLNGIADEYNDTYHKISKMKMKPIDIKSNVFAEYNEKSNEKDPKFKVGNHARISKYENIFAEEYTPNWREEIFVIKQMKNTIPWTYVISDLNIEEIIGSFYEKELQYSKQKEFRIEKVIKRKEKKLYVK